MLYYTFNTEIVPQTRQEFIKRLFVCKNREKSDRLLGVARGRGTTWFLNARAEIGINIVLRHYYRGGLFGKLVKDSYLFKSIERTRAAQEFDLLRKMHAWGLPVPRPIAFQIEKFFCHYRADIMLEKLENTQDLSKLLQMQTLSAEQYRQIGHLIRRLHDKQIHHSDLNIHNILLGEDGKFWLIDFDKCGIDPNSGWKRANLDRLLRSFKKERIRLGIRFNGQDWQNLLEGYDQ